MLRSWCTLTGMGLVMAALVVISGDAQQQPAPAAQQPAPIFRTGINVVRVDVIVSDRTGQPVADLQKGDFQVTEDGKPQTIESFKLIKLDGGRTPTSDGPPRPIRTDEDEEQEASRDDVRLFGIFLDDYHVRLGKSIAVRDPLSKFIQTQLGPSDMVGVMYPLQPVTSVRMTRNHDAVIRGIAQFTGRKYDYTPRNDIEEQYSRYPAETVENIRNQVSLSALKGLIVHMGTLKEGRKALIVVSEGFTSRLPPQLRDPNASMPGIGNPDRNNPNAGVDDPIDLSAPLGLSLDLSERLREVVDMANRNNVAIYAVDPRGLPVSEFDLSQPTIAGELDRQYLNTTMDTLRLLSDQTDGRAIINRNDLALGMTQIMTDTSAYYLLAYNSTPAPTDGKFHEIKVQVRRPGVRVRARRGYWAVTTQDVARALAPPKAGPPKAVENALGAISQSTLSHASIRTWIGTSRGANGKTKITFVWEPVPSVAGDRDARTEAPARVLLTAIGSDGSPSFRGRVPDVALASTQPGGGGGAPGAAGALPRTSRVTFEANPGKLQLRMSVEGSASQVLDTDTREIAVPDLTSAQTIFGTPEVLRARTARDYQQLKTDPDAVPIVTREFVRSDRLLIRVPAYGAGATAPALSVHILNRTGQAMSELQAAPSPVAGMQLIDLPLAGLAAGEYILEIKAIDGAATELVAFRVTG